MPITANSIAPGVGVLADNVPFEAGAQVLPRKILILAQLDPGKANDVDLDEPKRVLSAEAVGAKGGFGYMAHRLAKRVFETAQGVPVYISYQDEPEGAAQASGEISITASDARSGVLALYIAGERVSVNVETGDDGDAIAEKIVAAIENDSDLPVTAEVDGTDENQANVTAKSAGPWGDAITLELNLNPDDETPSGVDVSITDMSGGSGVPDLETALKNLGAGDDANSDYYTDVVHGYLQETAALDEISQYVGEGNTASGLYARMVHRPFRALTGDTKPGESGFTDLISLADGRRMDRANGVIAAPGSPNHPSEIAALALGAIATIDNRSPAESYAGTMLPGVYPGSDRWTDDYEDRDSAARNGIGATRKVSGVLEIQNMMTFYRPEDVPPASNGYRFMRSIALLQNIMFNISLNFRGPRWKGFYVVEDVGLVTNPEAARKARDTDSVRNDLVGLTEDFAGFGWIFSETPTLEALEKADAVVLRENGTGFDITYRVVFSGEGGILNTRVEFDTSLAVVL